MSQFFEVHPDNPQIRLLRQAAQILHDGGLAAVPTDSSYAFACHLDDRDAVVNLRRVRGVDEKHHLTLLCRDLSELATYARDGLGTVEGITVRDRGTQRSGIVTFTHSGVDSADLVDAIKANGINVSLSTADYARADFDAHGLHSLVRVSPHAYNSTAEIDALIDVVARATGTAA